MDERSEQGNPGALRSTYDRIASHFARTRERPWPEVEAFVAGVERVDRALDLGCANGRHAELLSARASIVIGVDFSRGLLHEAVERAVHRGFEVDLVQGDVATLPLVGDSVDLALYVATVHHLPDRETRVRSFDELARVLSPGSRALVSAWSTAHDRFDADAGFDTTVDWTLPGGETVPRFYHIYAPDEFEVDLADSALTVESCGVSSGNCYATVHA